MREFLFFLAATLLFCGLVIVLLTECPSTFTVLHDVVEWVQLALGKEVLSSSQGMEDITLEEAVPEELLSLYWMRRSITQPYTAWFLHDKDAYSTVPLEQRLPHSVVAQGQILFPLHVMYLRLCGAWLQWTRPDIAQDLLTPGVPPRLTRATAVELRQSLSVVAAACVLFVGAPAVWCLVGAISRLLQRAAREREGVARLELPADECAQVMASALWRKRDDADTESGAAATTATPTASSSSSNSTQLAMVAALLRGNTSQKTLDMAVFLGSMLIVLMGLLPLLVMEMCTVQPWCLCGSLLIWAVYAVLQDEEQLHACAAETGDDAFDVTSPIVVDGHVVFFALKQQPSLKPLVGYSLAATLMSLTLGPCLYVTPFFLLWALTSCWQHAYKRVLVKVRVPDGVRNAGADADGYVRVGYSCYCDKLWMNTCFCFASLPSVLTLLLLTTPWWLYQQPPLSLMDLFSCPPLPTPDTAQTVSDAAAATTHIAERSFTGARELQASCLRGPYAHFTCAQPAPNVWLLSEWFGVPWTTFAKCLTRIFTVDRQYVDLESPRWLEYVSVVLAVLMNGASVLVLTFYRIRKPPLSFETPVGYATERAAQQAEQQAYWEAKRAARRGGARNAVDADSAGTEKKRVKVVTCLSREEYIVKQVTLLCWMLTVGSASGTVFCLRNGPASSMLVFTCCSLVGAVYAIVCVLRRAYPLSFHPLPTAAQRKAASAAATATAVTKAAAASPSGEGSDSSDPSALTQQDRDDPRPPAASRWCTSPVAPSLAHIADPAWLFMCFTACMLGTGALSWMTVPVLLRQWTLVILAGRVVMALAMLWKWAKTDFTSWALCLQGVVGLALLIIVLAAQAFPQSAASVAAGGQPVRLTDRMGDMYTHTGENALLAFIYQCTVSCFLYVCCMGHATLRIGRLVLEPEEVSLVPIESELSFFNKATAAPAKKQQ